MVDKFKNVHKNNTKTKWNYLKYKYNFVSAIKFNLKIINE